MQTATFVALLALVASVFIGVALLWRISIRRSMRRVLGAASAVERLHVEAATGFSLGDVAPPSRGPIFNGRDD